MKNKMKICCFTSKSDDEGPEELESPSTSGRLADCGAPCSRGEEGAHRTDHSACSASSSGISTTLAAVILRELLQLSLSPSF